MVLVLYAACHNEYNLMCLNDAYTNMPHILGDHIAGVSACVWIVPGTLED